MFQNTEDFCILLFGLVLMFVWVLYSKYIYLDTMIVVPTNLSIIIKSYSYFLSNFSYISPKYSYHVGRVVESASGRAPGGFN